MPPFVTSQQVCITGRGAFHAGMNAMRIGRPNTERRTAAGEVGAHRRVAGDMFEGSRHRFSK
jgi:hypothetical protein